uniref:Small ribosomal subunit protein mS26 n=1 Tax=Romanomermis culicivorax TaxID=13658 RepID=A0A915J283_ROMCU
ERKIGDEFEKILLHNEQLNAQQAELRAEAFEEKKRQIERSTREEVKDFLRRTEEELKNRELEVEQFIEMSQNYVTPENLNQKLLDALENPLDLEFAIDTAGNVYTGNKTKKYLEEFLSIETKFSAESAPCVRTGKLEPKEIA